MSDLHRGLDDVLLLRNQVFEDDRGKFFESYQESIMPSKEIPIFEIAQINNSISRAGTVRGVHFSTAPEGQAKLVTCIKGSLIDLVIDLRKDSSDFLKFVTFELVGFDGQVIYIPSGFGHAFMALEDNTVINYCLSSIYNPEMEKTICPLDPRLSSVWGDSEKIISQRDREALSFDECLKEGIIGI